jgi:hypothetical protein
VTSGNATCQAIENCTRKRSLSPNFELRARFEIKRAFSAGHVCWNDMTCVSIVADTFVQSPRKPSITDDLLANILNKFNENGGADGLRRAMDP